MKAPTFARMRRLPLLQPLGVRDFRLLWAGESVSLLGNQFYLVALPWLTLRLTSSGFAVGTVLMAAAIPRAAFMLVGGALSDRLAPRTMVLVSNLARAGLTVIIAVLVRRDAVELWHLYCLGLLFGLADAFFYPAFNAVIPRLLDEDRLASGHSLLQSTAQLTALVGPALAGALISGGGLELAFVIDAATFIFAAAMLWLMRVESRPPPSPQVGAAAGPGLRVASSITEGLRYTWSDPLLRPALLIIALVNFSFAGPFMVGLSSLAAFRFRGDATAFGVMLSALGGGALVGALVSGSVSRIRRRGLLIIIFNGTLGLGLTLLGFATAPLLASVIVGVIGFGSGLVNVQLFAWLQTRVDSRMQGRVMSLVLLAAVGLAPFSYVLAGALVELNTTLMFIASGMIVLVATALTAASREVRAID